MRADADHGADPGAGIDERARGLLRRMTLKEKAAQMFHQMVLNHPGVSFADPVPELGTASIEHMVLDQGLTHFNVHGSGTARQMAQWHNRLQDLASHTRLGIPVTLSTDPRHGFLANPGTALRTDSFSRWPEPLGLAAVRDLELVEQFADTVRREYLAVGLRVALHPQVDLLTEPRWARAGQTFGESSALTGDIAEAYVRGLRNASENGTTLGPTSVAAMAKHFPGGGAVRDGEDPHFDYGREQVYPGGAFQDHLAPFVRAIAAGVTQMMPSYGMPVGARLDGNDLEEVGFAFSKQILGDLLRDRLDFDGIICTDWGVLHDTEILGQPMPASAWGLEHLTPAERALRAIDAGVDQFGGEASPEIIVRLVDEGRLSEGRVDQSVLRLLREKLALGLFDQPHVDEDVAADLVGGPRLHAAGFDAQRRSITVLANNDALPIALGTRIFVHGFDRATATRYGQVVDNPADAQIALRRFDAPYEPRPGAFEARFHAGSLAYPPEKLDLLLVQAERTPTVFCVFLDRPAVLTELVDAAAGIVVDFGTADSAVLDVLFGIAPATGRLPFDLPSSMSSVEASPSDLAFSAESPLFRFGHGLDLGSSAAPWHRWTGPT